MKKQLSKQSRRTHKTDCWGLIVLLLVFLWLLLAGCQGLSAQTVTITPIGANYGDKTVTFRVSWSGGAFTPVDRVWVWIDFCPVTGVTPSVSFSPASIYSVNATNGGSVDASSLNGRGFFVTANPTEVTATLSNAYLAFNWCAYGSGAPPRAELQPDGSYKLKGTPPFKVNDASLGAAINTYSGGCIDTFTDFTENPAAYVTPKLEVFPQPATRCGAGAVELSATAGGTTTANTYTWVVDGGAAQTTSTGSLAPENVAVGSRTYSVTVTNTAGCVSAANTGTITVHGIPTITYDSGSTNQTVNSGTAITAITYNTSNATGASLIGQPTGVSGSWTSGVYTISGTPSNTGTFTYTVTATNSNGCTGTTASGTMTVKQSCTNCASWSACTSVESDYEGYVGTYYSGFTEISTVVHEWSGAVTLTSAKSVCAAKGEGWRVPVRNELVCICQHKYELPEKNTFTDDWYWCSTGRNYTSGYVVSPGCQVAISIYLNTNHYVKCVR
jgi:hypothetical protein